MAVEIAIRAFRPAERPVDIDGERLGRAITVTLTKAGVQRLLRKCSLLLDCRLRGNDEERMDRPLSHSRKQLSTSLAKAWARWLILCCSAGFISPNVSVPPTGTSIGS